VGLDIEPNVFGVRDRRFIVYPDRHARICQRIDIARVPAWACFYRKLA
jgi:hypothetical protein